MISVAIHKAIDEALAFLPRQMNSPEARVMLYATGMQESRFEHRRQIVRGKPVGPAKSFWQFEAGGGCRGVLTHDASKFWTHKLCEHRGVVPNTISLWNAMENDDVLAAGAARLLYFTDPKRLPGLEDAEGAWGLYLRTWRPGKPHEHTWAGYHSLARSIVIQSMA